ncbi:MAG: penicillin-insensitive murein endopeptidase [Planctomycetota bacterium]
MRSGPGTRFREVGALTAGQEVTLQDWIGPWYAFEWQGSLGWVHRGNLKRGPYTEALTLGDPNRPQAMGAIVTPAAAQNSSAPAAAPASQAAAAPATSPNGTTTNAALAASSQAASNASQSTPPGSSAPQQPNRPTSNAGFVQLAASGPGFYSYTSAGNRWGLPSMIYGIERVGRRWEPLGNRPRIGSGDISYENGGRMRGHVSHRKGEDLDVRPVRNDLGERPVTIYQNAYSRSLTRELINLFYDEHEANQNFDLCLFNDRQTDHTRFYPNHHHHFHLRIHR